VGVTDIWGDNVPLPLSITLLAIPTGTAAFRTRLSPVVVSTRRNSRMPARDPPNALDPALAVPSAPIFAFKAPFNPASSSSSTASSPAAPLKQRRVSIALPSSTRAAWNFRDDTSVASHVPETVNPDVLVPEKRGKMRKIAASAEDEVFPEKKQRKKWSEEETQMLVKGCNIVSVYRIIYHLWEYNA
jgi:hypothetical protein